MTEDTVNVSGEELLWEGSPSHVTGLGTYVLCLLTCVLIVPIVIAFVQWLKIRSRRYQITTQRIFYLTGIFNKNRDQIEIYRVKDIRVSEPFFLRLFGKGNIILDTSDKTTPVFVFEAVPKPRELADVIRQTVEARRVEKGVREVDMEQIS
ncbi:MAG: hypothetical protein QG656_381 [Candidatus Hydrogenedentes bacterium]|nr:hypothetical protein [Candidatus Hydrogenedentota bacterium]